jgi:hypothetical protein
MNRRASLVVAALAVFVSLLGASVVSAATISLPAPLSGVASAGDLLDLSVTFDPNGSAATNLVGQELYVGFTGLTPVAGSYQLGSVFTPYLADVLALDGLCADTGCNYPEDDQFSSEHYLSLVNVFAPSTPSGPGGLFTLQFLAAASGPWTLNLFGDDGFGLLWDPPPQACDPDDLACDPDPVFAPILYSIVPPDGAVDRGIARVDVGVRITPAAPPATVPEPSSMVLMGSGIAAAVAAVRRRKLL